MLNRHGLDLLVEWFRRKDGRKPLLMRGARQVGKTTLVRMLAERLGVQLVEINLEKPWGFAKTLKALNPRKTIESIEFELNIDIDSARSIIFFDEVQAEPGVLPLLRYFHEETPEFRVIATGSLLDFVLAEPTFSIPVGRLELFHLDPLSFEEFLLALGEKKALERIKTHHIADELPVDVHEKMNRLLRSYMIVGGMPEAVDTFAKTKSIKEVERVKSGIVETFRMDLHKYIGKANPRLLAAAFDRMPQLMGRKLIYSHIDGNSRSSEIANAVRQLCLARIASKIFNCRANGVPLGAEKDDRFFKMLLLDVGLLLTQLKVIPIDVEEAEELNYVNNGALAEQFIGQQLYCLHPWYTEPELYYWAREQKASSAEVDYVMTDGNNNIVPIEVKAGSTGSLRSLQVMVAEKSLKLAVRFNSEPPTMLQEKRTSAKGDVDFVLLSLPHYMVGQIGRLVDESAGGLRSS